MKCFLFFILFMVLYLPFPAFGGSIIDGNSNTISIYDRTFWIHDGIKITDKYFCIGKKLRIPISEYMYIDSNDIYIFDDSTLVFGKYRYHLSKLDEIRRSEAEEINATEVEEEINTDEIILINNRISVNKTKCSFTKNGHEYPLKGRVKIVDSFEDIKVKIVDSGEDLRIHIDDNGSSCFCFKITDYYSEDIKVKIVDSSEDIKVRIVDNSFESVTIQ